MAELQKKLSEVLKSMHYTFEDLASHLGMSEQQLTQAIEERKLELRTLEYISKELRIPLYSFFRGDDFTSANNSQEEPFYINKINQLTIDHLQIENIKLRKEIDILKQRINDYEKKIKTITINK